MARQPSSGGCDNPEAEKCRRAKDGTPCGCNCHAVYTSLNQQAEALGGGALAVMIAHESFREDCANAGFSIIGHLIANPDGVIIVTRTQGGVALEFDRYKTGGEIMQAALVARNGNEPTHIVSPAMAEDMAATLANHK